MDKPIVWTWWQTDEPEDGLLGFFTAKDRDNFAQGKPGPYRRNVSPVGKTISQTEDWHGMVARVTKDIRHG